MYKVVQEIKVDDLTNLCVQCNDSFQIGVHLTEI